MNTPEQLSESLLAACREAGIEKPGFIAQDQNGFVHHYHSMPTRIGCEFIGDTYDIFVDRLDHPPYAKDWQDSLLEWVDHVVDTNKKVDDAISMEYHERVESDDGSFWSRIDCYRSDWQIALAWKVMAEENLEK